MARQSLLSVVLGLRTDQFEKGLTTAQRKLRNTANNLSAVGRSMTVGLTAPLAAVGASSFKVAADFELAMKKVKAVSGATSQEFKSLEKNARDLGASTVFSASAVSGLQLEFAKLGLSADEINNATVSTLALAQAFDQELGPTAEVVGNTLNQFGLDASEAGRVADVMASAFGGSALDLVKFQEGMKNAGKVADTFGFSLEETTALLGVLANNGIAGSDAGTKLKMAFSELAKQGVDVKSTFTGLINGTLTYQQAIGVLGKRAAILQPIFGENLEDLEDLGKELQNSAGRAKAMSAEMDDTAKGGLAAMRSAVEAAQISIGTALAPTVINIVDKIRSFAQSLSELNPATQRTIVNMGLFLAGIGPVTSAIGGMIRGIQNTTRALKAASLFLTTNPYGVIIAGAVALGTALYNLNRDTIIAEDSILDFNETIEAQNDLLSEGVRQLAARGALLRDAFNLEAEGETIQGLTKETNALRAELESISPDVFQKLAEATVAAQDDFELQSKLVPVFDPDGKFNEEAAKLNQKLFAEFAGLEFSDFTIDLLSSLDPFDTKNLTFQEEFDLVSQAYTDRLVELQKILDEKTADLDAAVNVVVNVEDGDDDDTLESVQADLAKTLADIVQLETLLGEDLNEDKFQAIERAINKIVEADFAGADEVLASLVERMQQFAEETEHVNTPLEDLDEAIKELTIQQGLGLVDDLDIARQALAELEQALVDSVLADPDFINTEAFTELLAKAQEFRDLLAETNTKQKDANEKLFDAQDAGQATADLVGLAFQSATGEVDNFGQAATRMLANIALTAIKSAIAQAISLAFSPTPDNVATGGTAGIAKAAANKAAITSLLATIPKLKSGGMTVGETLSVIGDNPSGREFVIPFERMGAFLGMVSPMMGGNMNVTGRIAGADIVLSHERANRNRGR